MSLLSPGKLSRKELGDTDDPKDLLPGDLEEVTEAVVSLGKLAFGLNEAAAGMKRIDSSHWEGQAADKFREFFHPQPGKWNTAGDAFTKPARALQNYAAMLQTGQADAGRALQLWQQGTEESEKSRTAHNQKVKAYNEKADAYNRGEGDHPGPTPGAWVDPGKAKKDEAKRILDAARRKTKQAADDAAKAFKTGTELAPEKPSFWGRVGRGLADEGTAVLTQGADLVVGAYEGLKGLGDLYETLSPTSIQNLMNPLRYARNIEGLVTGIYQQATTDPQKFAETLIDLDTWKDSPGKALGHLVPDIAIGAATGGAGAAAMAAADGVTAGLASGAAAVGRKALGTAGREALEAAGERAATAGGRDALESAATKAGKAAPPPPPPGMHGDRPTTGALNASDVGHSFGPRGSSDLAPAGNTAADLAAADQRAARGLDQAGQGDLGQRINDLDNRLAGGHHGDTPPGTTPHPDRGPVHEAPEAHQGGDKAPAGASDEARQAYQDKYGVDQDALDRAHRMNPDMVKGMTNEDILAGARYTDTECVDLNDALRSNDPAKMAEQQPFADNLNSMLDKLPNHEGPVRRGITVEGADLRDVLQRYEPGTTIKEPGFTSTAPGHAGFGGNVEFQIYSRTGKDISEFPSRMMYEEEVLFGSGTNFKVLGRDYDSATKKWIISLDEKV
ncbi:hypothetical protein D5S17_28940 [Pseudonocardiaceae bacterium YIM PH 21723]|nr:hypothetical protein D5S17_28940 [Pseudonocardiaceae bacterium YIM PH 21723]